MPLIQDNSYLLDFDKDDTLGYIFNYNIYANKNDISIWKDSDNEKLFFNVANAYCSKLCHAIRGYEVQYSVPVYALFTELITISVVKSDNINDEQHLFWWVNKTYDDASRLSEKLKKKDTPPQNTAMAKLCPHYIRYKQCIWGLRGSCGDYPCRERPELRQ